MNKEVFAEWFRRQNCTVVRTSSSYWYEAGLSAFQAFPFHWVIAPTPDELTNILLRHHAIGLRYSTSARSPSGSISYHVIYDAADYTMEMLDRRSRQNVRKGLENCIVEPISLTRLADEGWELENDTQTRQGRAGVSQSAWRQRCLAAAGLPGFEAWGAIVNGRLAASLLSLEVDDCATLLTQQCHHDFMHERVNNALTFAVTQTLIRRPHIRTIFYTLQSLDAPSEVDEFKFRMGYRVRPVRQRVVLHPWLEPLVGGYIYSLLSLLRQRYPQNEHLAKSEGMLLFWRRGHMPASRQEWPDCLGDFRDHYYEEPIEIPTPVAAPGRVKFG